MANNKILGKNFFFEMEIAGIWYPVFCGKTAEKVTEQDEIEVTHVNSGSAREYVPGMSNFVVNATGVSVLDNSDGKISPFYLDQVAIRRSINTYRLRPIDQSSNTLTITFSAFVRSVNISRDVTQWSQCSVSLRVTGELTYSTVIPEPAIPTCEQAPTLYKDLADGSLFIQDALLVPGAGETINILHVSRSGSTYYETSGTPGNNEFQYDSVNGKIIFQNAGNPAAPDLEPVSIEYNVET